MLLRMSWRRFLTPLTRNPLTAVLELDEEAGEPVRRARVRLIDPRLQDTYSVAGVEHPLEFDLGAQVAACRRSCFPKASPTMARPFEPR